MEQSTTPADCGAAPREAPQAKTYAFGHVVALGLLSAAGVHNAFDVTPAPSFPALQLNAAQVLGIARNLLGEALWDATLGTYAGRTVPSDDDLAGQLMRRADGAPRLSAIQNLDPTHREPVTGRPRSVRALVDDLLGVPSGAAGQERGVQMSPYVAPFEARQAGSMTMAP